VYAVGNSDMLTAIELRSGRRLWDREVGGLQTPWVAEDFVYVITNAWKLACFETATGKVRWVKDLPEWVDPDDKEDKLAWYGPILAGGSLILVSTDGKLLHVSPMTGETISEEEVEDGVGIPPVVSNKTLLLVTRNGILLAYR
jgi:outer membrane protein assembly factor BamB